MTLLSRVTPALLQRFSPADRAGLDKMDYVWTVNGKEVNHEHVPWPVN